MAVYKILNVVRKKGEYQGRSYDNVITYAQNVGDDQYVKHLCGPEIEAFKVKYEQYAFALGRALGALNSDKIKGVPDLEGILLHPIFDKYGTMIDFNLSLPSKPISAKK